MPLLWVGGRALLGENSWLISYSIFRLFAEVVGRAPAPAAAHFFVALIINESGSQYEHKGWGITQVKEASRQKLLIQMSQSSHTVCCPVQAFCDLFKHTEPAYRHIITALAFAQVLRKKWLMFCHR